MAVSLSAISSNLHMNVLIFVYLLSDTFSFNAMETKGIPVLGRDDIPNIKYCCILLSFHFCSNDGCGQGNGGGKVWTDSLTEIPQTSV